MPNQPTDTTLPASWDSLELDTDQVGLLPGARIGRFDIVELLGHGGMGAVYLARDEGGGQVALKTLYRVSAAARERLKREFRSLAQVRHPSLVQLYELYGVGDETFFTMEYVQGRALTADIASFQLGSGPWEERVRLVWKQLVHGLHALHTRELLHLDLKPDNILITAEGQVKILDFGLAQSIRSERKSSPGRRSGTPRYMAPEILRGETPRASADFFALGVILRQLLTGDSLDEASGSPSLRAAADLWEVSRRLMVDHPAERPKIEELLRSTGEGGRRLAEKRASVPVFVGREGELGALRRALEVARSGQPQWVEVLGESGVGKSALVRQLRAEAAGQPDVVVLSGACHERESTPFQGLDGVMEDLARLTRTDTPDVALKEQLSRAAEIFPAFCPKTDSDSAPPSESDPLLRRRRAFGAIRRVFSALTESKTVLVFIDDLQWADPDGARLLAELLSSPTPQHVCLVTTRRAGSTNAFVDEVHEALEIRGSEVQIDQLQVGRLSDQLSLECLRGYGEVDPEQCEKILAVAGGLPFLVAALGQRCWDKGTSPSLERLIDSWLAEFPPGAREVLLAVALSPIALPQVVALEQAGNPSRTAEILASLRFASLVRSEGESPDCPLEPYHALIGEAVKTRVDAERKKEIRVRLAQSLEAKKLAGPEHLATIYHLAEKFEEAGRYAPLAAMEAEAALAFETAAEWYERALEWTGEERTDWHVRRAQCLKNAGHEASAAECFERAACLDGTRREEFLREAGIAWLAGGHIDRGLAVLEPQLLSMNLRVPRSGRAAAFMLPPLLLGMWWRGIRFEPRDEPSCDPQRLAAADASWECAKSVSIVTPMQGLVLHLSSLKVSLSAGEPKRIARSLAFLSAAAVGSPIDSSTSELIQRAESIAQISPDDYVRGSLRTFHALRLLAQGESALQVRNAALEGLTLLRKCPVPSAWEEQTAMGLALIASNYLGEIQVLHARAVEWLAESSDRRDLFAQILASQAMANVLLTQGRIEEARRYVRSSLGRWSQQGFTVQHFYGLLFEIQCDIHDGHWERARTAFLSHYDKMRAAQLLRNPISRREIRRFRCLLELNALGLGTAQGRQSERVVRACAKDLVASQSLAGLGQGMMFEAGLLAHKNQKERAVVLARKAISIFHACDYRMLADCFTMRLAQYEGDRDKASALADRLESLGVGDPEKFANCYVPRLGTFEV